MPVIPTCTARKLGAERWGKGVVGMGGVRTELIHHGGSSTSEPIIRAAAAAYDVLASLVGSAASCGNHRPTGDQLRSV